MQSIDVSGRERSVRHHDRFHRCCNWRCPEFPDLPILEDDADSILFGCTTFSIVGKHQRTDNAHITYATTTTAASQCGAARTSSACCSTSRETICTVDCCLSASNGFNGGQSA